MKQCVVKKFVCVYMNMELKPPFCLTIQSFVKFSPNHVVDTQISYPIGRQSL